MGEILDMAKRARAASLKLASYTAEQKNTALEILARSIVNRADEIKAANALDVEAARGKISAPMLERLSLSDSKIASMAEGVRQLCLLPDPVGEIIESTVRPNGMRIDKVRVPIGVIGIIYESRPNVTVDCAALCLKSGNASILRGGSECFRTNTVLAKIVSDSLAAAGAILADVWTDRRLPTVDCLGEEFIKTVKTGDRIKVYEDGTVEIL